MSLLGILALTTGCGQVDLSEDDNQANAVSVTVGLLEFESESRKSISAYGRVEPPRQLVFRAPGGLSLTQIRSAGEKVKKGEVLAQFDTSGLQQRKSALQSALSQNGNTADRNQLLAELGNIDQQITNATVVAPFDLVVKSQNVRAGVTAIQEQPIMQVVENGVPRISTRVPPWVRDLTSTEPMYWVRLDGKRALCTLEFDTAMGKSYSTIPLMMTLHSAELHDQFQEFFQAVNVEFDFPEPEQGFLVPVSALVARQEDDWRIFFIKERETSDGKEYVAIEKPVEVVATQEQAVLVKVDLQPGTRFITRGLSKVVSGQRVRFTESDNAPGTATESSEVQ